MSDNASLLDAGGHLSAAGIAAFQTAAAGQAPEPVATHLAACGSCQERLLVASSPRARPRGTPLKVAPSPGRTILLLALTLLMVFVFLFTLRKLVSP
jgi:hypothetical protein